MRARPARMLRISALVASSLALSAPLAFSQDSGGAAAARGSLPPSRITRTSRPVRLLRSWEEPVKSAAGESARRVDVIVDYATGQAWERFSSPAGEPL